MVSHVPDDVLLIIILDVVGEKPEEIIDRLVDGSYGLVRGHD